MKSLLRNLRIILVVFSVIAVSLLAGLVVQQNRSRTHLQAAAGENKQALAGRYRAAGDVVSADGVLLAHSAADENRSYAEDPVVAASFLQLVGDYTHNIANTVESNYQGHLLGTDRGFLPQLAFDVQGKGLEGDDVHLTLRADLNKLALTEMGDMWGAVVMLNYKTGDLLASVSNPTTVPDNVISYEDIPEGALFNRAFLGSYAPGSSYKYVTTAAWIQAGLYDADKTVTCTAATPLIQPDGVKEGREESHGDLNVYRAMEVSCNHFFGQISIDAGRGAMLDTARSFQIGRPIAVDKLSANGGAIEIPERDSTLSWIGIGQPVADSKLYLSPLQMAMMVGAVANDGVMQRPHVVSHFTGPTGKDYGARTVAPLATAVSSETAAILEDILLDTVAQGSASSAQVSGLEIAGKTGTAEVEGQDKDNALFVGYIKSEEYPYAIAVVCEDAGFGAGNAAPIAAALFEAATQ